MREPATVALILAGIVVLLLTWARCNLKHFKGLK
mgnify:CR=1 FL=1